MFESYKKSLITNVLIKYSQTKPLLNRTSGESTSSHILLVYRKAEAENAETQMSRVQASDSNVVVGDL